MQPIDCNLPSSQSKTSTLIHLNSLQLQLENLRAVFEDELLKDSDIRKIKTVYIQITGLERMIAERKSNTQGEKDSFDGSLQFSTLDCNSKI
jgi:hypothetical protein